MLRRALSVASQLKVFAAEKRTYHGDCTGKIIALTHPAVSWQKVVFWTALTAKKRDEITEHEGDAS